MSLTSFCTKSFLGPVKHSDRGPGGRVDTGRSDDGTRDTGGACCRRIGSALRFTTANQAPVNWDFSQGCPRKCNRFSLPRFSSVLNPEVCSFHAILHGTQAAYRMRRKHQFRQGNGATGQRRLLGFSAPSFLENGTSHFHHFSLAINGVHELLVLLEVAQRRRCRQERLFHVNTTLRNCAVGAVGERSTRNYGRPARACTLTTQDKLRTFRKLGQKKGCIHTRKRAQTSRLLGKRAYQHKDRHLRKGPRIPDARDADHQTDKTDAPACAVLDHTRQGYHPMSNLYLRTESAKFRYVW